MTVDVGQHMLEAVERLAKRAQWLRLDAVVYDAVDQSPSSAGSRHQPTYTGNDRDRSCLGQWLGCVGKSQSDSAICKVPLQVLSGTDVNGGQWIRGLRFGHGLCCAREAGVWRRSAPSLNGTTLLKRTVRPPTVAGCCHGWR